MAAQPRNAELNTDEERLSRIINGVRRAILTLPEYGVFDHLWFGLKDSEVLLRGYASRPVLKSSAESAVKRVKGVELVRNEIEVLPTSPNDDRIRAGVYARVYGMPSLQRYTANRPMGRFLSRTRLAVGITNDPPPGYHAIQIVVKNGDVTLYGAVDSAADFTMAEIQARMTPGTFAVFNEVQVAGKET